MTDFNWWQDKAFEAGGVLCQICFLTLPKDDMEPVSDNPGKVWDICKGCADNEKHLGGTF